MRWRTSRPLPELAPQRRGKIKGSLCEANSGRNSHLSDPMRHFVCYFS